MGYYITCEESSVTIKDEAAALVAILREHRRDPLLTAEPLADDLKGVKTLDEAFDCCFWELIRGEDGKITGLATGNTMVADVHRLFSVISPYVGDGSFINIIAEDGESWKINFQSGRMTEEDWDEE